MIEIIIFALIAVSSFAAGLLTRRSALKPTDHRCPHCGCSEYIEDPLHEPPMGWLGTYYTFKCGFERDWNGNRRGFCSTGGKRAEPLPY